METDVQSDRPSGKEASGQSKVCHICGASVVNKPRQKDEEGNYWCMPCAKAADAERSAERRRDMVQCPDCGRRVTPVELTEVDDVKVCAVCSQLRAEEKTKAIARREAIAKGGEEEKKQKSRLIQLLAVAFALLLFTLYWNGVIKL